METVARRRVLRAAGGVAVAGAVAAFAPPVLVAGTPKPGRATNVPHIANPPAATAELVAERLNATLASLIAANLMEPEA